MGGGRKTDGALAGRLHWDEMASVTEPTDWVEALAAGPEPPKTCRQEPNHWFLNPFLQRSVEKGKKSPYVDGSALTPSEQNRLLTQLSKFDVHLLRLECSFDLDPLPPPDFKFESAQD